MTAALAAVAVGLSACGGGGGGGAAEPRQPIRVTVTADATDLLSNKGEVFYEPGSDFATNLRVEVRNPNGQSVVDGTVVGLSVSSSADGTLSTTDDLRTQTTQLNVTTTAGNAQAVFHTADGTGNTTITATVSDPQSNQNISASVTLSIAEGPDGVNRITLTPNRLTIPANPGIPIFFDSPYIAEVDIIYREADGTIGAPQDGEIAVSISPVSIAAFSTLDDPSTDENEFFVLVGNGPVDLAAGGKIFVHSGDSPGIVTVTASGQDAVSGEVFDTELQIEIVESGSDGRPANLRFGLPGTPQYVQGAGGTNAQTFQVSITDGADELVADPTGNNVFLQIFTESPDNGAELRGTDGAGNPVSGTSINLATTNGIASASIVSGSEPGLVRIRAVADAADNNVSNGIEAEVRAETSWVISDGVPFSVTITTIPINSLTVNPVSSSTVAFDDNGFPLEPDATYSLRVNAIVTDRFGNPPASPVTLQAGLIDAPISGFPTQGAGTFDISGSDGDPFEGGTGFFAPLGQFVTAGGGAGPGDTLILFGKSVVGNADLESARTVSQIIDQDDLIVDEPFNFNDTRGGSVDNGAVIPYVVGRATTGNVESSFVTDSNGVGSTVINYPVSQLGRSAALYIQGANSALGQSGNLATYADATLLRYPGVRPLRLTVAPTNIPANVATSVLICVEDAATAPIRGQFIGFAFSGLQGTGTVDGVAGSGTVGNPTGEDGCTVALVETAGVGTDADEGMLDFFTGDATATVTITPPSSAVLQAEPSAFRVSAPTTVVPTLRYLSSGAGVAGIAISGTCMSNNGIISIIEQPALTDENGETTTRINVVLDDGTFGTSPGDGTCTFEASDGTSAEISFEAIDICALAVNVSPGPPPGACTGGTGGGDVSLTVEFDEASAAALAGQVTITATGAAISCVRPAGGPTSGSCADATIVAGSQVNLSLNFANPADELLFMNSGSWLGACAAAGSSLTSTLTLTVDSICRVQF
ncbi:MAG: hypothetical protein AAGA23_14045 [Pseudomonadota bacterium]